MKNNIEELKKYFTTIKNNNQNSLREGNTGIGYTFETLINKKEDNLPLPDFNGIEIKTKLGYSKSPLTLFSLTPKKENDRAIKYIIETFGYLNKDNYKTFKTDIYVDKNKIISNKYIFKLKIDKKTNLLKLLISDINLNLINDSIYWDLDDIKNRLETKFKYLAYIIGYPYKKYNRTYYKYNNLKIYKLKSFNNFIELFEKQKIYITINIEYFKKGKRIGEIHDRGTAFRLSTENIEDLFVLIDKI